MKNKFSGYLIVSDMDATLLCDNHTVSEKNRRAIEYFIENGGAFTVATGRMVEAVKSYIPPLTLTAPALLHNGAKIYDFSKDTVLYEKTIEEDRKNAIKRAYDEIPEVGLEVYSDEKVYVYRRCEQTKRFLTRNYDVTYELPDDVWEKPWIKVLLIGNREVLDKYEPIYREKYDSGCAVRSGSDFLDVVANGVSKGNALDRLIEMMGFDREKVIAVGDNMNDISMLEAAGISYAVENAEESAKQIADYIAPSNNDDAIAFIIENLEKSM